MSDSSLWIFGYGSLVWRPAFPHRRSCHAFLDGWVRRFWQGSTDHRGLPERPGRVVTLVREASARRYEADAGASGRGEPARCWGRAFEIEADDPDGVLARLDHRERGGYARLDVEIGLIEAEGSRPGSTTERVRGLVYVAHPRNRNYLGPAAITSIAEQIAWARGPSGPNPEYVFELERSLAEIGDVDPHVTEVAAALRAALAIRIGRPAP